MSTAICTTRATAPLPRISDRRAELAFGELFGAGRGGGLARESGALRTLLCPGPLHKTRRANGRPLLVRIIRIGDEKSSMNGAHAHGRVHEDRRLLSVKRAGDTCLVEFLEPPRAELAYKWPTGFPCHGAYYVGTLRAGDREDGLTFSVNHPESGIAGEDYVKLLAWLDEQLKD